MAENPYQAPRADSQIVGVNSGNIEGLRNVARYQKGVLMCILIQILGVIVQLLLPPSLAMFSGIALIAIGIAATVFVFLLATNVYTTPLGIVLGILTLIPCIGLIVLLIVNSKATTVLRQNGIKVGLLGANLADV
jgi:hypothetical protein